MQDQDRSEISGESINKIAQQDENNLKEETAWFNTGKSNNLEPEILILEETKVDEEPNAELLKTTELTITNTDNDQLKSLEENNDSPSLSNKIDTQKSDYLVANMIQDRSDMSGESPNPDTNTDTLQRGEMTNMTLGQNITDRNANFSPDEITSEQYRAKMSESGLKYENEL